jgi:glycosyltransferase involved in cell wall biosynthesis
MQYLRDFLQKYEEKTRKRKRALHVTNAYPNKKNSSYGIFVKEQVASLEKKNINCEIIFIDALSGGKLEYLKKVNVIRQAARSSDIVHCHHTYSAFLTIFFARVNKPVIASFLSSEKGETETKFRKFLYRRVIRQCAAFIDKSDPGIEDSHHHKGHYLPNGVDMQFFQPARKTEAQRQLGLVPGTYALFCASGSVHRPEKRYDLFRETLYILNKSHGQDIKELILSNVDRSLTPHYFNAAAFHLLTSDYEGSPNSIKEAMSCNLPVVSTDVGNVKGLTQDVKGCYVSLTGDPNDLATLCLKALKSQTSDGRSRLLEVGLGMDAVAEKLCDIYRLVLNKSKQYDNSGNS